MEWKIYTPGEQPEMVLPLLVMPVFEEEMVLKEYRAVAEDFEAKLNKTQLIYTDPAGSGAARMLLVGLGKKKSLTLAMLRRAIGTATIAVQAKKIGIFGIMVPPDLLKKYRPQALGEFIARAVLVSGYSFDLYKTRNEAKVTPIAHVSLFDVPSAKRALLMKGLEQGTAIAHCVNHVRELGNTPPIEMTPAALAKEAQAIAELFPKKVRCTVLDKAEMKKEGMGALLGVAQGSVEPPKFIILEYRSGVKSAAPIVLVGKGITFDSGGISIKPADKMDEMKFDMLGGATVLGTICAAAKLGLRVNLVGLVPATENLPGGSAYRPGDILRAANGKTIEIINTDAEGRLILADALSYAERFKPRYCIDLATLTGACLVALGIERAGLFTEDEKLLAALTKAAQYTGDALWRLPLGEEYSEAIKSDVADLKNSTGREGSASTAAAFLQEFVSYPWAHLDIAGTAWNMKSKPWMRAGATGHGVHLLIELLRSL